MKVGQFEDTRFSYCWNSLVLRSVAACAKEGKRYWCKKQPMVEDQIWVFGYWYIGIGIGALGIWILIYCYCNRYWYIGYLDIGARNSRCRWWKIKFGGIGFLCMVQLSFVGLSFAMLNFHFIRLSFLLSNFVNIQRSWSSGKAREESWNYLLLKLC